jgi:hypothetical protein
MMPGGHSLPQTYAGVGPLVSQTQSGPGGGPQHVGGHVLGSTVPGGQRHAPPSQIGSMPASLPHESAQNAGIGPLHGCGPASERGPASSPRWCEPPQLQPESARPAKRTNEANGAKEARRMRAEQHRACQRAIAETPCFVGDRRVPCWASTLSGLCAVGQSETRSELVDQRATVPIETVPRSSSSSRIGAMRAKVISGSASKT